MTYCAIGLMQNWLRMGSFSKKQTFFYFTQKFNKQFPITQKKMSRAIYQRAPKSLKCIFRPKCLVLQSMSHFNTLITSNGEENEQLAECRIGRESVFMFLSQLFFILNITWSSMDDRLRHWLDAELVENGQFHSKKTIFTSRINFTNSS
jgi:hypothetical protein